MRYVLYLLIGQAINCPTVIQFNRTKGEEKKMKRSILAIAAMLLIVTSAILTITPSASAAVNTFGQGGTPTGSTTLNTASGSRYTNTIPSQADSISAYLSFTPSSGLFGKEDGITGTSVSIKNSMRGQAFSTPAYPVVATTIQAWIDNGLMTHKAKAAIYDASGNIVAQSNEISVSVMIGDQTRTFTLTTNPMLSPSTTYIIVVWAAERSGICSIPYETGGNGREAGITYGTWPSPVSFNQQTDRNYYIWCNYQSAANVQCAIYSADGTTRLGVTEQKTLTTSTSGLTTFNFNTKPTLSATDYVLAAWSNNPAVNLYYTGTTAQAFTGSGASVPATLSASGTRNYNLQASITYNTITASAGTGGSISPSGAVNVAPGSSQSFTITPNAGYYIADVQVDGSSVGALSSYDFTNVNAPHAITASYAITQVPTELTVECTPETVDKTASMDTVVSGYLLTDLGAPVSGQKITLTYNGGESIGEATTQADGSYTLPWTVPSTLANGFYVVNAEFVGDNNPYMSSSAFTTSNPGGGGLFVVPEYALGAFAALGVCLAGFAIVKTRRPNLHQ